MAEGTNECVPKSKIEMMARTVSAVFSSDGRTSGFYAAKWDVRYANRN
jgi:hypothetical protein